MPRPRSKRLISLVYPVEPPLLPVSRPLLSLLTALIMTVRLVLALYACRGQSRTQCPRNPQRTHVLRERRCSCLARDVDRALRDEEDGVLIILITPMLKVDRSI
jgi:hypothetical protein